MSDKKYQIFVSSTYADLIETRKRVIESILDMDHFPVGMEMFSADDADQWSVIQRTIDESDYYVVIIGHRYGSIELQSGISYTEKEYDYAVSKNIPVLAFIRDRDIPLMEKDRESDQNNQQKLNNFLDKAKQKMCQFWRNNDDLIHKVPTALFKSFKNNPQIGWVRGDQAISVDITNELARLSKENNELKEKLKNINDRENLPKLGLKINNTDQLIIEYPNNIEGIIHRIPKKITMDDIPENLANFTSYDEIEEYNNNLPTQEKIDGYNENLIKFKMINEFAVPVEFSIGNYGKSKANDIFISIDFPEDLIVFRKNDKPEMVKPISPLPFNPIIKAQRKYEEEKKKAQFIRINPFLGESYRTLINAGEISNQNVKIMETLDVIKNRNTHIKNNNQVIVKIDNLLHTLNRSIDEDIFICAYKKGKYEIKVSLMCEQYKHQEKIIIPVIVE